MLGDPLNLNSDLDTALPLGRGVIDSPVTKRGQVQFQKMANVHLSAATRPVKVSLRKRLMRLGIAVNFPI